MKVRLIRGGERSQDNIMFPETYPMRGGKFPKNHPCFGMVDAFTFASGKTADDPLGRFREKYGFASCFPEGDGICFTAPKDKPTADVAADIRECFGWEV